MKSLHLQSKGRAVLEYYHDLIFSLLSKEFKVRYKSTFLGYVWSVLHPLMFTMVYFFLFKIVMKIDIENYTLFLVAGVFPWQAFQNSVCSSSTTFIANSSLIKRVRFPREFLVVSSVLNDLLHFLLSIPIIALMMVVYRVTPHFDLLWGIPVLLLIQFLFTLGVGLLVATSNLFLRDLERLITIITMMWFYITPVLFREDWIPARYQWTCYANPMAALIISWRRLFLAQELDAGYIVASAAWAAVGLAVGYSLYRRMSWRFAELV